MTDYTKLRELAQAATPGTWAGPEPLQTDDGVIWSIGDLSLLDDLPQGILEEEDVTRIRQVHADAEFIAAANPTVVLALLDELVALRRGQGAAPAPATPGTTRYHATDPIPDSTGGTR